jgi:hypothetical protein
VGRARGIAQQVHSVGAAPSGCPYLLGSEENHPDSINRLLYGIICNRQSKTAKHGSYEKENSNSYCTRNRFTVTRSFFIFSSLDYFIDRNLSGIGPLLMAISFDENGRVIEIGTYVD